MQTQAPRALFMACLIAAIRATSSFRLSSGASKVNLPFFRSQVIGALEVGNGDFLLGGLGGRANHLRARQRLAKIPNDLGGAHRGNSIAEVLTLILC